MKIFVTGVAGFIGSNLTVRLLEQGHQVVGFDNLSQGDVRNMALFQHHPAFSFCKGDVLNQEEVLKASEGCGTFYHLAAFKIPRYEDAYQTIHINTAGTANVVEAAVRHGARMVFASTSDVYGKNPNVPFTEEHDLVIGPPTVRRWAYALSKAIDEQLLFAEGERRKLDFTIVRFFGGYGPNQNTTWWGGPQSVFINHALENTEMTIHGDGLQSRSFTYVDDHVEGLYRILGREEARGQVFNLGSAREITIIDLAKMVWQMVRPGDTPKLKLIPYSTFGKYEDVMRRVPDTAKAKRILGFEAKWTLEEGLPRTIEWQRKRGNSLGA